MNRYDKMENIPVGSGFIDVYLFILRQMLIGLGLFLLIISFTSIPITMKNIFSGNMEGLINSISIYVLLFGLMILIVPLICFSILIPSLMIWFLTRKGNRILLKDGHLHVNHQNWSMVPSISNTIPLSRIKKAEVADKGYWSERWRETGWFWKILRIMPVPPNGGLYPMYSRRKNLVILYLDSPKRVNNQKVNAFSILGMTTGEHWVREVIIDVDPQYQYGFIHEIIGSRN